MKTMIFLMVVLLGAALMGCDMMQPGADYQPDAVEVSEDAATEVSEAAPRTLAAATSHTPGSPRLRAIYRSVPHRVELQVTPPRHFGTPRLRRYEYQVDGGSWSNMNEATCLAWSSWQDGWTSGSACLESDVMMLILSMPATGSGAVTYGVRAVGRVPGTIATATVHMPTVDEDAPSQEVQRPILVMNQYSDKLDVLFQVDGVRVNHQNTIQDLEVSLFADGSCEDWLVGGSGLTRRWGDRNINVTVSNHPDGLEAREVGLRIRHRTPAWGECVRVRR